MRIAALALLLVAPAAFADAVAGAEWTAPKSWTRQPDRPMRVATYAVAPTKGDSEPAELGIFYFGPNQGGGVDANVARWIGQFEQPDGKPSDKAAKTGKKKIAGMQVTTIDLTGNYMASMGPMSPVKEKKADWRLLGAIVEAPEGAVFFKMVGPKATVAAAQKDFDKLLKSLKAKKK